MRAAVEPPNSGSRGPARISTLLRHVSSPATPATAVVTAAAAAASANTTESGDVQAQRLADSDSGGDAPSAAAAKCPFRTLDGAPPGPLRRTIPDVFDPTNTDPDVLGMLIRPLDFVEDLVDVTASLPIDPAEALPGPLQDKAKFPTFEEALRATLRADQKGVEHLMIEE